MEKEIEILTPSLSELGLNETEIKLYIYLLEKKQFLGDINITEICKYLGINRVSGYKILEKLDSIGVIQFEKKSNLPITVFQPQLILEILEKRKNTVINICSSLRFKLPELSTFKDSLKRNLENKIITGQNLIEETIKEFAKTLNDENKILIFGENGPLLDIFCSIGVEIKGLLKAGDKLSALSILKNSKKNQEFKTLAGNFFTNDATTIISESKMLIVDNNFKCVSIIENIELIKLQKNIFYGLWEGLQTMIYSV